MATSIFPTLVAFLLLAATASARPCKTLFFFSAHGNPNPIPNSLPRGHFTLVFTTIPRLPILRPLIDSVSEKSSDADSRSSDFPLKFYPGAVYLVYVILSRRSRRASAGFDDVESCSSSDDVAVAKKFSYSPIPSVPKLLDDDLKKSAKEVV